MTAWHTTSARITGFGLAALVLMAGPIDAAPTPGTVSYLVRTNIAQAGGTLSSDELLTLAADNGRVNITLVQQDTGATAGTVAPIDEHGVIDVATSDPALTCYNTAQGLIANHAQPTGSALSLLFAGNTVNVPLTIATATSANGSQTFTVGGRVEGSFDAQPDTGIAIVIDGAVRTQANRLAGVQLRETTMFAASNAAIGQTTCSLSRVIDAKHAQPA